MNKQNTPLFHISKRAALPWYAAWGIRGGAILLALLITGLPAVLAEEETLPEQQPAQLSRARMQEQLT